MQKITTLLALGLFSLSSAQAETARAWNCGERFGSLLLSESVGEGLVCSDEGCAVRRLRSLDGLLYYKSSMVSHNLNEVEITARTLRFSSDEDASQWELETDAGTEDDELRGTKTIGKRQESVVCVREALPESWD